MIIYSVLSGPFQKLIGGLGPLPRKMHTLHNFFVYCFERFLDPLEFKNDIIHTLILCSCFCFRMVPSTVINCVVPIKCWVFLAYAFQI